MFFLKYRPQTLEELDLKEVRDQLKKILAQKEVPHALLFAGPKGAGKTSAARILAKIVNCPHKKGLEPCNQCHICREITKGISLDVLEIDAASNRGIDDIRQLKQRVGLAPVKGKYKVYIIDEAHMLTKEAFNALLKTLEEPPSHVIFILCTTNPEKIIPTVLSRLIRIDFHRGSASEVRRCLEKVVKGEKLKVDEKVIKAIIDLADGGFRDAQKILEESVLFLGKKIGWKKAGPILQQWREKRPESFLRLLAEKNLKEVLSVLEQLAERGVNFINYLRQLLDLISKLILIKVVGNKDELNGLADLFSLEDLTRLSRLFSQAALAEKTTLLPQLPLQLAVIEFTKKEMRIVRKVGVDKKIRANKIDKMDKIDKISKKTINLAEIEKHWNELLTVVKPMNHSVAAFLRAAKPREVVDDALVLEVFYQFHKDRLEEERNRRIVEDGLIKTCGCRLKIKCVLGEKKVQKVKAENKSEDGDLYEIAKEIFGS